MQANGTTSSAAPASSWTVADVEDFEAVLGLDFAKLRDALDNTATTMGGRLRVMAALVWIQRRRDDPAFTFEAARHLPLTELTEAAEEVTAELMAGAAPDPTTPPPAAELLEAAKA